MKKFANVARTERDDTDCSNLLSAHTNDQQALSCGCVCCCFFTEAAHDVTSQDEHWTDFELPPMSRERRLGLYWTAAIAIVGVLLIGALLFYHRVLMPVPVDLNLPRSGNS